MLADQKSFHLLHDCLGLRIRWIMEVFLCLLLAYLSIPVVQNLFSSRQVMNTSFDSLRIVKVLINPKWVFTELSRG